jgi:hypothetical protein
MEPRVRVVSQLPFLISSSASARTIWLCGMAGLTGVTRTNAKRDRGRLPKLQYKIVWAQVVSLSQDTLRFHLEGKKIKKTLTWQKRENEEAGKVEIAFCRRAKVKIDGQVLRSCYYGPGP